MFKACGRSCCIACVQLFKQPAAQLHGPVCMFLHQHLLKPISGHCLGSDPDLESCDTDRPCLAEETFEHPALVDIIRAAVPSLSGELSLRPVCFHHNAHLLRAKLLGKFKPFFAFCLLTDVSMIVSSLASIPLPRKGCLYTQPVRNQQCNQTLHKL